MNDIFRKVAHCASELIGSPKAFILALLIVVGWGLSGSIFHYSDTWQLIINTGTTIVTFLMLFLVQNTQNRDAKAIHLKLDGLILAIRKASNTLVDVEDQSDKQLSDLHDEFKNLSLPSQPSHSRTAETK